MIRSIALVTTGTLASRLTGFLRDALVAALLGAGAAADAFLVAFQLVTLIRRLLTEGALNAAFVPAWLQVRDARGEAAASAFAGRALGTIGLGVALIALVLGVIAPPVIGLLAPGFVGQEALGIAVTDARLMLPYLAFAGPVAVMIALANAQRRVALSSTAPVLFNMALIAAMAVLLVNATDASRAAWIVAATVGIAGLLQLAMLASANRGASPIRFGLDDDMRALLRRAVPGMIASAGPQMLVVAGAVMASRVPSGVSWLYFASRLIDLPLGMVSTISGAVLVTVASHAANDAAAARTAQAHAVGVAMALALPAAVGLFVLAEPIVQAVFARGAFTASDAEATARVLQMLALGLPAQALAKALSPSFYARGDTMTPMLATLVGLAVGWLGAFASHDVASIAAAISLGGSVGAAVLLLHSGKFFMGDARLIPIAFASLAMGAGLVLARSYFAPNATVVLPVAALIAAGLAINVCALLAFGALRPAEIRAAWRRRDLREGGSHGKGTPAQRAQDVSK
jgi:putative peptidoglycan lipid II flippase